MHIEGLDEFDNKILGILKNNARSTYSELGKQVGLSRVAVRKRIESLEKKGIIQGYHTIINQTGFHDGRRFFIDAVIDAEKFDKAASQIANYDYILRVFAVTGESRIRAEGYASSTGNYELYVKELRRQIDGIRNFIVHDVQYTIKDVDGGN